MTDFYVAVNDALPGIVQIHESFGDETNWHSDAFFAWEDMSQEEIFEIESTKFCTGSGACAVEEEFGGDQVCSFGCDWAWIIDFVASYCDSNTAWFFLSWAIGHHNSDVGCFAIGWHFYAVNESAGVGSLVFFAALE